jgi:hypothetical protein
MAINLCSWLKRYAALLSTALFAREGQSFPDNLIAGFGQF